MLAESCAARHMTGIGRAAAPSSSSGDHLPLAPPRRLRSQPAHQDRAQRRDAGDRDGVPPHSPPFPPGVPAGLGLPGRTWFTPGMRSPAQTGQPQSIFVFQGMRVARPGNRRSLWSVSGFLTLSTNGIKILPDLMPPELSESTLESHARTNRMDWNNTIIGSIISAVSIVLGIYLGHQLQRGEQRLSWERGREDELAREARQAIADLARSLGAAAHSMAWLTWMAANRPSVFNSRNIRSYDKEMHRILPQITGSQASLSSLSGKLFEEVQPLINEIHALDQKIARAGTRFLEGDNGGCETIATFYAPARELESTLNSRVAGFQARVPVHREPPLT